MIVLDSSAVIDYLVRNRLGDWVEEQLLAHGDFHAPHLIDVEVVGALRKFVQRGALEEWIARAALRDIVDFDVRRYPHGPFLDRAWALRDTITVADAVYVALAEALDAPLLTTDLRLGRAPGLPVEVLTP